MKAIKSLCAALALLALPCMAAAEGGKLDCTLSFTSEEWSAMYASSIGAGTVECEDGTTLPVTIRAKGVGIAAGKSKITRGKGNFTHVGAIDEVLGSYLSLGADAGMVKAGTAKLLSKGKVTLALAGKGEGFDIGIAITEFTIARAQPQAQVETGHE